MRKLAVLVLAVSGTLLLSAAPAAAQGFFGDDWRFGRDGLFRDFGVHDDVYTCGLLGDTALGIVSDRRVSSIRESVRDQDIDFDDDEVLLGIALDRAGVRGIDIDTVRDIDARRTLRESIDSRGDLDEDVVFAALALGETGSGLGARHGGFGCIADVDTDRFRTQRVFRDVDIDEDDAFLALAFARATGESLDFEDVASVRSFVREEEFFDRDVDVDFDDALLLLALD